MVLATWFVEVNSFRFSWRKENPVLFDHSMKFLIVSGICFSTVNYFLPLLSIIRSSENSVTGPYVRLFFFLNFNGGNVPIHRVVNFLFHRKFLI